MAWGPEMGTEGTWEAVYPTENDPRGTPGIQIKGGMSEVK